jgi:DNA-binding NarL/FixJ family response regulator
VGQVFNLPKIVASVVFLSSDLMFSSRLLGAAREVGTPLQIVANPADLATKIAADCRLVLVDLTLAGLDPPAAIATVRQAAPEARVVAFGAHVDEAALFAAQQAGCDLVLTRGQFHKQYVELLRTAAQMH